MSEVSDCKLLNDRLNGLGTLNLRGLDFLSYYMR